MDHVVALGLSLVIGIPIWVLVYMKTQRDKKRGLGPGYGGDTSIGGGHSSGGESGGDPGGH